MVKTTANLQPRRPTVAETAKKAGVSTRKMYYALKLHRSGRKDLVDAVMRDEMTIHAALQQVYPQQKDPLIAFIRAWERLDDGDKLVFLTALVQKYPADLANLLAANLQQIDTTEEKTATEERSTSGIRRVVLDL